VIIIGYSEVITVTSSAGPTACVSGLEAILCFY
jgi:hypothetical protein